MALKKSEIYSTLTKCTNKLRSNSGIGAESFKNYVLILLFLKYVSDRVKSGEKTILEIPEGCTFDDIIKMKGMKGGQTKKYIPGVADGYSTIGDGINKVIGRIVEVNELQDVINLTDHDFCDKKLGNAEDSSKLISELVSAFQDDGLDFSQNRAADDDLIGDAYEYLMRNFASQAGKDKGQFYTPTEVSRLIALLIGIDQDERPQISAYDPTCGSGSLLLRVRAAAKHNVSWDGQDIDPANIELSYLNMIIHGCETADIRVGDTLNSPQHIDNGVLRTYDYVVSNPKFSLHNWMNGAKAEDTYKRWNSEIGVPPQQYGDFAFLLHCVKSLKSGGKCAIILPNGVLTRGGDEEKLRKWLVEQQLLSGIIACPQNAFFGTSIAGNILIIDKKRSKDGVFFIDASELGYKDADSKIRLREQDIKKITDVWRKREDVKHFAHLATYEKVLHEGEEEPTYEIEHNGFALNLSLYVTPVDKEVHQNIEAHLHGGIPNDDINRLQQYWDVCSTLKNALFSPLRDGFSKLAVNKDDIAETIENNDSFQSQSTTFANSLSQWCEEVKQKMLAVDKNNDPKSIIAEWGQSILEKFKGCNSLVDAYDVYDQLMGYYNELLQDDLYMISNGGWLPKLNIPTKKTIKWTDLTCDLLPVEIAISHFLKDLKSELDNKENELAQLQEKMTNLIEENEGDFDDSLFYGKLNAANLKKKLEHCSAIQLTEDDIDFLNSLMPFFEKNNKANKETVASMCLTHEELFEGVETVNKKVVTNLLKNSKNWEYSTEEQRAVWADYACMIEDEKKMKDEIKALSAKLLQEILRVYEKLTAEVAKPIIVNEKWIVDITSRISKEMQTVTHNISAEVSSLAKRYENTLNELNKSFIEMETEVLNHLKDMGFEL